MPAAAPLASLSPLSTTAAPFHADLTHNLKLLTHTRRSGPSFPTAQTKAIAAPIAARISSGDSAGEGQLFGSAADDYSVSISIDGQKFMISADTGSDITAVAGSPHLGCTSHVDTSSACDRTKPVRSEYGLGAFWSGVACVRDISPTSVELQVLAVIGAATA